MGQRHVKEQPYVSICKPVVSHPPGPAYLDHPVGPQQSQVMRYRRLAGPGHRGQVADAHFAFQQGDEYPQSSGVREQAEHIGEPGYVVFGGHPFDHGGDSVRVHQSHGTVLETNHHLLI